MAGLSFAGRRWLRSFNWPLAIAPVFLTLLGVLMIQAADLHNASAAAEWKKQAVFAVGGIGIMMGLSYIDYRNWRRWAPAGSAWRSSRRPWLTASPLRLPLSTGPGPCSSSTA